MFASGKAAMGDDRLKQIQEELARSRAERIAKQSAYEIASTAPVDSVPQKTKEAGIASALRASNVRVVDPAYPAKAPMTPSVATYTGFGAVSGLLFGVMLLLARESLDRSFRAPGEAPFHLRLPELG